MKQITAILEGFGSTLQLLIRSIGYAGTLPRQWGRFIEQCYMIGYTTLPIVAILSFFIGSVLALQAGYSMQNFGTQQFIGSLVGLSMARELGPVMVAILVAGRVGSAIAAELASMKVYQEVDALVTMNIPPARMLVMPRLAASLVMVPVLALIGDLVGWFGGALVSKYTAIISIEPEAYFAVLRHYTHFKDVLNGLVKAEIFGFVVVLVCCNIGLNTRGGPREIGASVTRAVVVSLILILVLDYFVTQILT
ncbi:MAG: phospholipid/cholesterol/gamma-HCH transport system permease protein [Verrucomicrobia bacterium]|jgi:phospholipid/cholesterol/gamma-HCH transport system permease protein|nr:MAG: phospholipid/cholesterol/gamma-HCH transport system permease protein [Verrucomicrobiota bacterium]